MLIYLIRNRWTGREIATIEAPTSAAALEWAVSRGISLGAAGLSGVDLSDALLGDADLRGASLVGSDLSGCLLSRADLRCADFCCADLSGSTMLAANLEGANLRRADLSRADLRHAILCGADLRDALLVNANLRGTILDWRWSAVPCEILRRSGGGLPDVWAELAFDEDTKPYGWVSKLYPAFAWATQRLAPYVRQGDNAPGWIKVMAAHGRR